MLTFKSKTAKMYHNKGKKKLDDRDSAINYGNLLGNFHCDII